MGENIRGRLYPSGPLPIFIFYSIGKLIASDVYNFTYARGLMYYHANARLFPVLFYLPFHFFFCFNKFSLYLTDRPDEFCSNLHSTVSSIVLLELTSSHRQPLFHLFLMFSLLSWFSFASIISFARSDHFYIAIK